MPFLQIKKRKKVITSKNLMRTFVSGSKPSLFHAWFLDIENDWGVTRETKGPFTSSALSAAIYNPDKMSEINEYIGDLIHISILLPQRWKEITRVSDCSHPRYAFVFDDETRQSMTRRGVLEAIAHQLGAPSDQSTLCFFTPFKNSTNEEEINSFWIPIPEQHKKPVPVTDPEHEAVEVARKWLLGEVMQPLFKIAEQRCTKPYKVNDIKNGNNGAIKFASQEKSFEDLHKHFKDTSGTAIPKAIKTTVASEFIKFIIERISGL